jgi:hypothetical protein
MDATDTEVKEVPSISLEDAKKMVQFLETGIVSIDPPLFGKLLAYGLLQ